MSHALLRSTRPSLLLLASLMLVAATLAAGCGGQEGSQSDDQGAAQGDQYVGTWIQTTSLGGNPNTPITIAKDGDDYTLTGPDPAASQGYMLHTDPTASGEATIYAMTLDGTPATDEGDHLTFGSADNTVEIAVSGDEMTMVVSSVDGVFTFERTGS